MVAKLLIVEDFEPVRAGLVSLVRAIPQPPLIQTADTLARGLLWALRDLPTMIVLDLHLPDGNAVDAIHALKALSPQMLIVVWTNDASERNRSDCLRVGADWFFDKSTEHEELLELIRQHARTVQLVCAQSALDARGRDPACRSSTHCQPP